MRYLQVGQRIDRYEILDWVEYSTGKAEFKSHLEGGLGVVYRAYDLEFGDDVVLKTYKGSVRRTSRQARLFWEEAETWIRLGEHPHVVRAFDVFEHDARYYVVIEFVPDGNLRSRIGRLSVKQAVQIGLGICRGMVYVSETLGMVHRDLKPENVLLSSKGVAKITDFGPARIFDEEHLVRRGPAGTYGYMAPEQRDDARSVDTRADIYAFGIILHEVLTGRRPEDPIRFHPDEVGESAPELTAIVDRCLRPEVEARFPTFRSIEKQMRPIASALGVEELEPTDPWESEVMYDVVLSIPSIRLKIRGDSFQKLGEFEEAIARYTQVLESEPERADVLSLRGAAYGALGRSAEAEADFEKALSLDPRDTNALLGRARLHAKRGETEQALRYYDAAIESDPRCWESAMHHKAVVLESAGDLAASLACYDELLEREKTAELLVDKALILEKMGNEYAALEVCEAALSTEPDIVRALAVKALLHDHLGQLDSAIVAFQRLLREDPADINRPWLLNRLGICYSKLGNRSAALQYHEKAYRLAPDNAHYFWKYANGVERLRGWSEAIRLYKDHVAANPGSGESWYRLGKAYAEVGKLEQARGALKRCLQLGDHAYARGLLRHLGED
jgi:serine/threonine protein kinase